MACKVTVNGAKASRYKELEKKFGQRAALEAIIEEDNTASIDGFFSSVEEGSRVNALTFATIEFLVKNKGEGMSILDLSNADLNEEQLRKALNQTEQKLATQLGELLSIEEEELTPENRFVISRTYVALANFEQLVPKIIRRLNAYKLEAREMDINLEEDVTNDENSENDKEHIYNKANTQTNTLDNVLPQVKMFLATLPSKRMDRDGDVHEVLDDIGMKVPVDFGQIYSLLVRNLADASTLEEMYEIMESMAEEVPVIADIVEILQTRQMEPDSAMQVFGRPVNNFENAFFSSFAQAKYDYITTLTDERTTADGERVTVTQVLETNKRDTPRELRNRWAAASSKILSKPVTLLKQLWNDVVAKHFDPTIGMNSAGKTAYMKKWRNQLESMNNKAVLATISENLKDLNISVSVEGLAGLRRKLGAKKFADFVITDLHMIAEGMYNKGKNIFTDEGTTLNVLAEAEAVYSKDLGSISFMDNKGNQIYPINLPTFITELLKDFKEGGERLDAFVADPMFRNMRLVKEFAEGKGNVVYGQFETLTDNRNSQSQEFSELDPVSSMVARMSLFMNYRANRGSRKLKADTKNGWFLLPTPGDRTNSGVLKVPVINPSTVLRIGNIFQEGLGFREWAIDQAQGEFERIKLVREEHARANSLVELIPNYHYAKDGTLGNGGYFQYFAELNEFLVEDENGTLEDIDFSSPEVIEALEHGFQNQIRADLEYMAEIGFLAPLTTTAQGGTNFANLKVSEEAKTLIPAAAVTQENLLRFVANSIIVNHESSAILYGDIAHVKSQIMPDGTKMASWEAANKRARLASTPGRKLRVGNTGARENFTVAYMETTTHSSEFAAQYIETLGKAQGSKYLKTDHTDGQAWVSLERYMEIMSGLGQLTPALYRTIRELQKHPSKVNWSRVTEPLVPIKGFLSSNSHDSKYDRVMPKSLKYSMFPVVPAAITDNKYMQLVHKSMTEGGIDELVYDSAGKIGAYNINSTEAMLSGQKLETIEMSNKDWRLAQVVPYKAKTAENMGSQARKIVEGDVNNASTYVRAGEEVDGQKLKSEYQESLKTKIRLQFEEFRNELYNEDGTIDVESVANAVLRAIEANKYTSVADTIERALQIVEDEEGNKTTRIPLSFPAIKHRVESTINSMARKAAVKHTIPGFAGVVFSAIGRNGSSAISGDTSLQMAHIDLETGRVIPAEIRVSPQYFVNSLKSKQKRMDKTSPEYAAITNILERMNQGTFSASEIPESLREVVLYRIPTQGKNSMLPAKIVEFLPTSVSTAVMVPSEVVTQSGMDYDIDKVYVEMKPFNFYRGAIVPTGDRISEMDRANLNIVETHLAVLTNPEHFESLMLPNNTDTLESLKDEIEEIYAKPTIGRKWSSVATQDDFRDKNQAGGIFIGTASNANTGHALFQQLGVTIGQTATTTKETATSSQEFTQSGAPQTQQTFRTDAFAQEEVDEVIPKLRRTTNIGGIDVDIALNYERPFYPRYAEAVGNSYSNLTGMDIEFKTVLGAYHADRLFYTDPKDGYIKDSEFGEPTEKGLELIEKLAKATGSEARKIGETIKISKEALREWNNIAENVLKEHLESSTPDIPVTREDGSPVPASSQLSEEIYTQTREAFAQEAAQVNGTLGGIKVNGRMVDSLSQEYNVDGGLISNDHMEIQTAAVDNAANPLLGHLNINQITGSVYLFLVEAGAGLRFPTLLVNTPIIRELVAKTRAKEAALGRDMAYMEAIKELSEEQELSLTKEEDGFVDITMPILEEVLRQAKDGETTSIYDADILNAFRSYRRVAEEMRTTMAGLRNDVVGTKQTLAENLIIQEQIAAIPGTIANAIYGSQKLNKYIRLDADKYRNHSVSEYEQRAINEAIEIVSDIIADATVGVSQVITVAKGFIGRDLTSKDIRLLINDFYTYMMMNKNALLQGNNSPFADITGETFAQMMSGDYSVASQVIEAQKYDIARTEGDISLTPNQFLQSLSTDMKNKKTGADHVRFNNTISRALTADQKTMFSDEYTKLFSDDSEYIRNLGVQLFVNSFMVEGFSRGTNSYSEYTPLEAYEHYRTVEGGYSPVEFFKDVLLSEFESTKNINYGDFISRFVINRGSQLQSIPNWTKLNAAKIKERLKSSANVGLFLYSKSGETHVGLNQGTEEAPGTYMDLGSINTTGILQYQAGDMIEFTGYNPSDVVEEENSKCNIL